MVLLAGGIGVGIYVWSLPKSQEEYAAALEEELGAIQLPASQPGSREYYKQMSDLVAKRNALGVTTPVAKLEGHTDGVISLAFSPDGKTLASGCGDGTVKLWDAAARKEIATLEAHSGPINIVRYSNDGKYLLTGSHDRSIVIWNAATRQIENRYVQPTTVVYARFLPDNRHFVTVSYTSLLLWSIDKEGSTATRIPGTGIVALDVDSQGRVAVGTRDGRVVLWEPLAPRKPLVARMRQASTEELEFRVESVRDVLFLKNGHLLVGDIYAIWEWELPDDKMAFRASHTVWKMASLEDDRFLGWSDGHAFHVNSMDSMLDLAEVPREAARSIAYSRGMHLVAFGYGGQWDDSKWTPAGPLPIELYDANAYRGWLELDEQLVEMQRKLPNFRPREASATWPGSMGRVNLWGPPVTLSE
jgi:WD40 repeat protein